jgi:hypothetical protein
MKKVIVGMMLVSLMCASAQAMLLDNMSNISGTQWVETRGTPTMAQSAFGHDGNGSMEIKFGIAAPAWDIVPQRYFDAAHPPVSGPWPYDNQLNMMDPTTNTITMWVYADQSAAKARVNQIILFSYATGSPARFDVPLFATAGWNKIIAPRTSFAVENNDPAFLWSGIQTFQLWTSTWDTRGTSSLFIDDIQLVPEPATMTVLGLGSLLALRRKK